jgi:hypothetical protein
MLRRYVKQLITTLFTRDTKKIKNEKTDIDRQVDRLKQMQRSARYKERPIKKETVL